jgi:nitrogen fixation/metabolism regulation signal transduction histidine kinase
MATTESSAPADGARPRHRRHLKNLLLDRHFQLKYAAYLVVAAALISSVLGVLLWRTSGALVAQSREAVGQGQQVVALGQKVTAESRKVSEVVRMTIVKDPVYSDSPELLETFKQDADAQDATIVAQQQALEAQAAALEKQSSDIESSQRTMLVTLYAVLAVLVVALGLVGIVVTHKVAGPIFKMTRQIRELGEGRWRVPDPLRKGDELGHFFVAWEDTVRKLRHRRESELEALDAAIAELGHEHASPALDRLRADLAKVLG